MVQHLSAFIANRHGATSFDIALVVSLIALVLYVAVDALGGSLSSAIEPFRSVFD